MSMPHKNGFDSHTAIRGGRVYNQSTSKKAKSNATAAARHNTQMYYGRASGHDGTMSRTNTTETSINNPNLVGGLYEIGDKLGSGSFGEVRLGVNVRTGQQVAIKFEHKSDLKEHLKTEFGVYSSVANQPGFPEIYWFGKHGDYTALVMDRLGPSLKSLYGRCNRIFPVQTVSLIAIQLLDRLETLHNAGYLHQDIKPENIIIGWNGNDLNRKKDSHRHSKKSIKDDSKQSETGSFDYQDEHIIYLVDFGTSGRYIDDVTKKHRVRGPSTKIVGTARYSSLNNHYGYKQSRRDDLESLAYTLIYWLLGRLPWQGINEKDFRVKWKKVRRIKRAISPDELCRGLPIQFRIFLKYVFRLSYAARPNYDYLRGLFKQLVSDGTSQFGTISGKTSLNEPSMSSINLTMSQSISKMGIGTTPGSSSSNLMSSRFKEDGPSGVTMHPFGEMVNAQFAWEKFGLLRKKE